ncbi:MAG: class I SAM-dependent methyltransferase, partial [Acidimicrobiales bacterium]
AKGPLLGVDVGCGDGAAIKIALDACRAAGGAAVAMAGCDWSGEALVEARGRGLPVARASLEAEGLPFRSRSLDVVVMSELIEHLVDTDSALAEARRVLVPGGTLLLSTPNLAAWYNRALLVAGVQPVFSEVSLKGIYGRPGSIVAGHLRLFTRRALTGLLAANGFSEIEVSGAPYHDTPRALRPLDRWLCRVPGLSSILLVSARRPPTVAR